jgi:hypothetical protein
MSILMPLILFVLAWSSHAQAQACSEELRTLQDLRQQLRAEVMSGNTLAAVTLAQKQNLDKPAGYDFDATSACQKWALELAFFHRASCSFERAREQLKSIETDQPRAIDLIRSTLEKFSHTARVPFSCKDKKSLYLICQPASDTAPDAWCARPVDADDELEIPRHAWCKLVDQNGVEVSSVDEGSEPTCREELEEQERANRRRLRAARRESVAVAGTGIALLAAAAVPISFVPEGVAKFLRRVGALDKQNVDRVHHRAVRARQRVLPLLGVTALSVSALSSRFWWAGVLSAGCGVTADVMLAQHWHQPDKLRRSIGIASAVLGAASGLVLNLETLGYSDSASRYTFMPTLSVGTAQAELGLAGRF